MSDKNNGTLGGVTKDSYEALSDSQKLVILYDLLVKTCGECRGRLNALERRKNYDTAWASAWGFVGGFMAVLAKRFWPD